MSDYRSDEARAWRQLYATKAWRNGRAVFLRQHHWCERCLARKRYVRATVVNHRKPHKGDEVLFYDWSNWQPLCKPCHDGPTQQIERRGYSCEVGVDGYFVDPNHPSNR